MNIRLIFLGDSNHCCPELTTISFNKYQPKLLSRQVYLPPFSIPTIKLLSFGFPLHNRVYRFQMRWICHKWQGNTFVSYSVDPLMVHSKVIFYIPWSLRQKKWSQFTHQLLEYTQWVLHIHEYHINQLFIKNPELEKSFTKQNLSLHKVIAFHLPFLYSSSSSNAFSQSHGNV